MGRMTEWMFWIGLALLFGAGLLFGLAVAQAEAGDEANPYAACERLPGWQACQKRVTDEIVRRARIDVETARLKRELGLSDQIAKTTAEVNESQRALAEIGVLDVSGAAAAAADLARQTREQATDACEAQWGRNVQMVEHCRKQAGGAR
jgi:hypothetical protein